jgi:D-glycero-D-manno-heptose 1,7-bisphosphate phosphatase
MWAPSERKKVSMRRNSNAAVFLDRDGTIIEDRGHLRDPSDVVFFPETFEALQRLRKYFLLFIVSNQAGIAEGIITRSDVDRINHFIVTTLGEREVVVTDFYVCPHKRSDNCCCIKPKPYFLKRAAVDYDLNLGRSFTVGDHPHDVELARNTGAHGIYVLTGHGQKHRAEISDGTEVATGIGQAAEKILSSCHVETLKSRYRLTKAKFILNLGVACELWLRADLGSLPRHASEVARVLCEAGIDVYEVSGGWLACEPRPVGIYEALSGRPAPSEWAMQFNCPLEHQGLVLRLLAQKGIPVCDFETLALENDALVQLALLTKDKELDA